MSGRHRLPHALAGPSGPHSAIARTLSFHTLTLGGGGGGSVAPLTRAYVPEVIMTTCIYGCVRARARDVFIHSVRARGKFIELLMRLTSTTPNLRERAHACMCTAWKYLGSIAYQAEVRLPTIYMLASMHPSKSHVFDIIQHGAAGAVWVKPFHLVEPVEPQDLLV